MEREAAFHLRHQGVVARPEAVPPVSATSTGQLEFPPFAPPELVPTKATAWSMVTVRALMFLWGLVTAVRIDAASDDPIPRSPTGTVTAAGWIIVAAWLVLAARWSFLRTTNVHRLEGRYPTRTRAATVWAYPAVWVALMGVTLIPASPNPDFDYRPPIIVAGFALTMLSGYRIVHRIFKSLVRMPPTATCVAFYVVDVVAFGLIWWRVTSWTGRDGVAPLDTDLDLGILVGACVALAAGTVIVWYLDRAADRGQEIRLLALRTRYDHRMARLNGLDPMNPSTRYALMLARRAAERAASRHVDDRNPDALGMDDPLVAELARELELGITPDFAARVRELERRTDGLMPTASVRHDGRADASSGPDGDASPQPNAPPRLWLAELLRYLVVGVYAGCVAACIVLVVEFRRGDADAVEAVRRTLFWAAAGVHIFVALWATRIAVDARRFGLPALWRLPVAAFTTALVVVPLWFAVEVESDAAKLALFTVLTLGLELALWRVTAIDWLVVYRESDSPLEAWMSIAPFVLGLLLLSPMRAELAPDVSAGRVAFFATLIGLAAALSGGLAAVAMVQLEDALRATTPGDRSTDGTQPAAAPQEVAATPAPIERSAGTSRTPTAKPRAARAEPLRVDMSTVSPELAAGLGGGTPVEPSPAEPAPTDTAPAETATAKNTAAKKTAAKKTAAKKTAADTAPAATKAAKKAPAAKKTAAEQAAATASATEEVAAAPTVPTPEGGADVPAEASPTTASAAKKTAAKKAVAKKAPAAKKTAAKKTAAGKATATDAPAAGPDAGDPGSEGRPLALEADADHRSAHEDAADAVHQVEGAADRVGGLDEHVDDPDHGEQDRDVAEPGDDADQTARPGER